MRRADDRTDVAGIADPVQVETDGLRGLGPALRPDRDCPRARAQGRDRGEQLRLDLLAAEAAAGGGEKEVGLDAGGQTGLDQILALADGKALALAALALAPPSEQPPLLRVGGF